MREACKVTGIWETAPKLENLSAEILKAFQDAVSMYVYGMCIVIVCERAACVRVCERALVCECVCVRACIHAYTIHVCVCVCVCMRMSVCMHACMCVCVPPCTIIMSGKFVCM